MSKTAALVEWHYEQRCRQAVKALEKNEFTAIYCPGSRDAADYIIKEAANANTVGFGGSMTIVGLDVADKLQEMGKELLIHGRPGLTRDELLTILRRQLTCDLFLCSTNALTLDGYLVNVDATGNRTGSMLFGPGKVIVVVGRNKIVTDTGEALHRIKSYAAPPNARRLNLKTPCAETGFCNDCRSPERICRATVILERRPRLSDVRVLVVNENLGF